MLTLSGHVHTGGDKKRCTKGDGVEKRIWLLHQINEWSSLSRHLLPCCVVHTELSGHDHTYHPLPLLWTANISTMKDGNAGHDHTDHPLPLLWTANTSTMKDGNAGHALQNR